MRGPLRHCLCLAIGLSGGLAGVSHASDFNTAVVPARSPTTPGAKPLSAHPSQLLAAGPVTILSLLPAPDPGAKAQSYDLRVAREFDSNRLTPIRQSLRARGTGMRDAYLHGNSGLRASVGSSYHMQYHATDVGPGAAAGTAALMRLPIGAVNLRDGYENYAPVAMAGYDAQVSDHMKVGVEGGMMVGRSTAMYADETIPDMHTQSHDARNPVADVVMTYAF